MRSRGLWFGSLMAAAATLWVAAGLTMPPLATPAHADAADQPADGSTHATLGPVAEPGSNGCIRTASASTFRPGDEVPDTYWPLSVFAANADNLHSAADQARNGQRVQFILASNGSSIASMVERHFTLIRNHHAVNGDLGAPDEDGCAPL